LGQNYVTPRGLKSVLLNELVQVQGIVTRMSIVKPKIQTSVHYCEATKKVTSSTTPTPTTSERKKRRAELASRTMRSPLRTQTTTR